MSESEKAPEERQLPALADPQRFAKSVVPIRTIEDLERMAEKMAPYMPEGLNNPRGAFVAMAIAAELGLPMMRGAQQMLNLHGRICVWGETHQALMRANPAIDKVEEWWEVEGERVDRPPTSKWTTREAIPDDLTFICRIKRKGDDFWHVGQFSVADAKRLKVYARPSKSEAPKLISLWDKPGPWRNGDVTAMLPARARRRAERSASPETVSGVLPVEEAETLPPREAEWEPADTPGQDVPSASVDDVEPVGSSEASQEPDATEDMPQSTDQERSDESPDAAADRAEEVADAMRELRDAYHRSGIEGKQLLASLAARGVHGEQHVTGALDRISVSWPAEKIREFTAALTKRVEKEPALSVDLDAAITPRTLELVRAKRSGGDVGEDDYKRILRVVFGASKPGALTEGQGRHFVAGLEDGTIWEELAAKEKEAGQ